MSRSIASAMADRPCPSAKRVRSEAWIFAISSAAPTPFPETSPTSSATRPESQREVVEEITADLARRHGHALHFGQAEMQRRVRQHLVLNLPAQLELAPDALLLHGRPLVLLDVRGHLIEGRRELSDLVRRLDVHARVIFPLRNAADAFRQRRQVARQAARQRDDPDERDGDEQEAKAGVACRSAAQFAQQVADRTRNAEAQASAGLVRHGDDDPVADALGPRDVVHARDIERGQARTIRVGRRIQMSVLADSERNLAAVALGVGKDRGEQVGQIDLGVHLLDDFTAALEPHVQLRAGERGLPRHRLRRRLRL